MKVLILNIKESNRKEMELSKNIRRITHLGKEYVFSGYPWSLKGYTYLYVWSNVNYKKAPYFKELPISKRKDVYLFKDFFGKLLETMASRFFCTVDGTDMFFSISVPTGQGEELWGLFVQIKSSFNLTEEFVKKIDYLTESIIRIYESTNREIKETLNKLKEQNIEIMIEDE